MSSSRRSVAPEDHPSNTMARRHIVSLTGGQSPSSREDAFSINNPIDNDIDCNTDRTPAPEKTKLMHENWLVRLLQYENGTPKFMT